jgi:hypothetical protein
MVVVIEKLLGYIEQLAKCEIIKIDVDIVKPGGAVTGHVME